MRTLLKIIKNYYIYLFLLILFLFKGTYINIVENIGFIFTNNKNKNLAEIKILQNQVDYLKSEYKSITDLEEYAKYDYDITRISYRVSYKSDEFYIYGGTDKGYKVNFAVLNEDGLVGIITEVFKDYSKVKTLTSITNLSVKIKDSYGTITEYKDSLFKVSDLSNYDKIKLNDLVYTSTLGAIKESIYIGYVTNIVDNDVSKTVYIKNNVDYNHLNYLYVVGEK